MAKYDHGGGCPCGLYSSCECERTPYMKLSEKLKQTIDVLEQAKITDLEEQNQADLEKIRRDRERRKNRLDDAKNKIVDQIESGKVPVVPVIQQNDQDWLLSAVKGQAPHQDLWSDFRRYFQGEGLELFHDIVTDNEGMTKYINLSVRILPSKYRPMSSGYRTTFENRD